MSQYTQKQFVFVIGTRAQLIKVAPVIVECEYNKLPCTLLMTGQHLDTMSDLLVEFGVTTNPVFATPQKEHSTILSLFTWLPKAYIGIIKQLKSLDIESNKINLIIHGDTLTTAIGALAGKRVGAHVVHLESGLTSNKFFDPFPEELVRRFVFRLSNTVMCPDAETTSYMMQKYPQKNSIDTGGNTILDSIRISGIKRSTTALCSNYIVASLHRFQNIYSRKRLLKLVEILKNISENHLIYFVLHPATRKRLIKTGLIKELEKCQGVKLIPRLGYSDFLRLAADAACVITDGGSNQEELAALGVPTIIMRKTTERNDGLGKNAIMESEIKQDINSYIKDRKYKKLEYIEVNNKKNNPSMIVLNHLKG